MKTKALYLTSLAFAGLVSVSNAALLLATDAAAWDQGSGSASGTGNGGLVDQTISTTSIDLNLNGQPEDPSAWTHSSESWPGDFQGQDVDSLTGKPWIIYDLGATYSTLEAMFIITNVEANRGFKDIEIYYTSDLTGNPVTTWASDGNLTGGAANVVDYDFTVGDWTQLGSTVTLIDVNDSFGTQPQPSTEIDISGISSARYIGIRGLNSFNDDGGANPFGTGSGSNSRAGINQIAFTEAAIIPEPSCFALIGLASMTFLIRRRR